jgi:pimeloyl-ACP methyl ester carboxylesterase
MKQCKRLLPIFFVTATYLASAQAPWRYDLRPGDHLTYRYTLQRDVKGEEAESHVSVHFQTHVLVTAANSRNVTLGFQRNRLTADLTQYQVKGKDRLTKELPNFEKRMQARPSRFSEAMETSLAGDPLYAWEMARESPSHILGVLHEVINLPPAAVKPGEGWRGSSLLSLDFRWTGEEAIHGKACHRVDAASPDGSLKVTYWWSPGSGVLEQVELDGSYSGAGATVHENARMELESRARDERIEAWLLSADTRQGVLQAMLLNPGTTTSLDLASTIATWDDPKSQALAKAILARAKPLSFSSTPASSNCGLPLPHRPVPKKFGTLLDVVAATATSPEIPYLLRVPVTYREDHPAPLLVYLSGGAGLAMDGVNTAEDVVSTTDYLVLYPHAADYWWKPEVARRFDTVLKQVLDRYNVDRDRIYLTGFSNGGTGSLYFAALWPQRFAAVVSLMGAGQCMDQVKQGLTNLENLPLLFVHGEKDPRISPECSTTTHSALSEMHPTFKPELKILPGREHDVTLTSDDGLTLAFFKNKVRSAFPKNVEFSFTDAQAPRSYWIEILDGKPGTARVEAQVKSDNTIELRSHDIKHLRVYLRPELLTKSGDLRVLWNGKKVFQGPLQDGCPATAGPTTGDAKLDLTDHQDFSLP